MAELFPSILPEDDADVVECGAELARGGTCERPADECPYPSHG